MKFTILWWNKLNLKEKTLNGVKWNLLATLSTVFLNIILLWVLSHILSVKEYGVVSSSIIVITISTIVLDFGLSNSIIRSDTVDAVELSSLHLLNIIMGAVIFLLVFFLRDYISGLFRGGLGLSNQIAIISFFPLINSFSLQPKAMLIKEMRFELVSKITILGVMVNFALSIMLSYLYESAWCVALSFVLQSTTMCIAFNFVTRKFIKHSFVFKFSSIKRHIFFGLQSTIDSFINQISINTYPILMSRLVSLGAIGGYNIAYNISIGMFERLNPVLSQTLFPALSKLSDDPSKLKKTFIKATFFSSLINFPMLLGVSIIAKPLVYSIFDEKWYFIVPIVQILSLIGAVRSLDTPIISILLVKGMMYRNIYLGIEKLLLGIPLTYYLGNNYGIVGISVSFLIVQIVNTILGYFFLLKPSLGSIGLEYGRNIAIAIIHVIPMIMCGWGIYFFSPRLNNMALCIIIVISCMAVYSLCILKSPNSTVAEFRKIIFEILLRKVDKKK